MTFPRQAEYAWPLVLQDNQALAQEDSLRLEAVLQVVRLDQQLTEWPREKRGPSKGEPGRQHIQAGELVGEALSLGEARMWQGSSFG